jgi:hypothetical protein
MLKEEALKAYKPTLRLAILRIKKESNFEIQ